MESAKNAAARRSLAVILFVLDCSGQRVEAAESAGIYRLETAVPESGAVGHTQVIRVWAVPAGDWKINRKFLVGTLVGENNHYQFLL